MVYFEGTCLSLKCPLVELIHWVSIPSRNGLRGSCSAGLKQCPARGISSIQYLVKRMIHLLAGLKYEHHDRENNEDVPACRFEKRS